MYKNPINGIYELPWVRLHAIKDYYDMVAILDDFPKIKININLVPSLLAQLEEYAKGLAKDRFMDLTLKNANELNLEDKVFILKNFFMSNFDTMIAPYERYLELFKRRGRHNDDETLVKIAGLFSHQDFRDLQVWFNLSWFDPFWRKNDGLVKSLYEKGESFNEEDKTKLIQKQIEICAKVISKHKQAQKKGQVEVSVTPFYHPILPLLCDTNCALEASPSAPLPQRFSHPEDAVWQIENAVNYYEKIFGQKPKGMWPSEGSVSDEVAKLASQNGIKWIATDEAVLYRSKFQTAKNENPSFSPFNLVLNGTDLKLNIIFRNHSLSDSIGFVYSKWDAQAAVDDFIHKIENLAAASGNNKAPLINVILDGENCWEYYKNDGWDFLSALYERLSQSDLIETVRISDYLEKFPTTNTISKLTAGSWINADFWIWIGQNEDNTAWNRLNDARKFLTDFIEKNPSFKGSQAQKDAWENIYIAEGSDWNWWYGNDHSSDNDAMFDFLYRHRLIKVYNCFGKNPPENLYTPIKQNIGYRKSDVVKAPVSFISPKIDGSAAGYFKWKDASFYETGKNGGSMHQISAALNAFYFGFNMENFYIRFDLNKSVVSDILDALSFNIHFVEPVKAKVSVFLGGGKISKFIINVGGAEKALKEQNAAYKDILEIAVPFSQLNLPNDYKEIAFFVSIAQNLMEIERWPYQDTVSFKKPDEMIISQNWSV
jgi:alpha-amylase/alpha-mannosidase (GH57 family)